MKRIRVTVTQEDIDTASILLCPVARAVRRAGYPQAQVGITVWDPFYGRAGDRDWPLPASVRRFIQAFDAHRPVKPATFLLPVPE